MVTGLVVRGAVKAGDGTNMKPIINPHSHEIGKIRFIFASSP